jgi:predicted mannosyl-3-phosphoglycerate phosphatase (HAD superfamily)
MRSAAAEATSRQNDLSLHFGLGSHDHANKIEIAWFPGAHQTFAALAAERRYTIVEVPNKNDVVTHAIRPYK